MQDRGPARGPLRGVRIVEFFGIGPGPFAAMMLGDMGADVVSVARPGQWVRDARQFINRNRRVVELDLKNAADADRAWKLVECAEALIEGFRPGVMERLGFSPEQALRRRPPLVYGRMTGWGQEGPLAQAAGHDLNYIAVAGALDSFRASNGEPVQPLNLVGDYGGGALFLVAGILAALLEARASGTGQVVDAAMCDGTAALLSLAHSMRATGRSSDIVGTNRLDGGAHFYHTYACADGRYLAVACSEPQFYAQMRRIAGLDSPEFDDQLNRALWPQLKRRMQEVFRTRTCAEWTALFEGTDACVTPVVPLHEAPKHPHLVARRTFIEREGYAEPAPAPRFSKTPSSVRRSADIAPGTVEDVLAAWMAP
jgi:alpha-methylacyl-CoA racemase